MPLLRYHGALDELAMWGEDRRRRAPVPFRGADATPLDCFGPLPPLPPPPGASGPWRAPSPRPCPGDGEMSAVARPPEGPRRGTVVLVPPWKLPRLALVAPWERALAAEGLACWTLVPPRHLHRAAPGVRSGEGFVTPDVPALRAAMEQLVLELRVLLALARAQGGAAGVCGLSLGALAAGLAATAPEAADFAALVAPPADLAAVFQGTRIGRRYLGLARRAGAPPPPAAELAAMLAPFRPEARPPTARRVLVVTGDADRIALRPAADALAARWGAARASFPRGHLTLIFGCAAARRAVARFAAGR
ncbi:hypothetical protein ACOQFB_04615 [Anaeromyxobacter sp. Red801]|uniref:hypothetical protein n=1 Tax=Anaeromyxobacter sp. Red801 TaxID=3411632 RepID=UPI003B9EA0E3